MAIINLKKVNHENYMGITSIFLAAMIYKPFGRIPCILIPFSDGTVRA
jgi:hypothetical protein